MSMCCPSKRPHTPGLLYEISGQIKQEAVLNERVAQHRAAGARRGAPAAAGELAVQRRDEAVILLALLYERPHLLAGALDLRLEDAAPRQRTLRHDPHLCQLRLHLHAAHKAGAPAASERQDAAPGAAHREQAILPQALMLQVHRSPGGCMLAMGQHNAACEAAAWSQKCDMCVCVYRPDGACRYVPICPGCL